MICPTVSDLHFLLHINPFLASTRWTQPTSSPSFLYPFFHLRWKMSFCWCSPIFYRMYCQSSVSFCPYRISFGSVVRPQCYDFINQIKYILCRRERTSIVPNTSHTHRHMPDDMMRCATDVYTDVTATTNRFQCRRTRSIWNVIINNFDTQIHFTISIFNFSFPRLYNFEIVQF